MFHFLLSSEAVSNQKIVKMRVLHQMPKLDSPEARSDFYSWWGTENTVINADSKHCYYGPYRQRLSIKCAFGGPEHYRTRGQTYQVEDQSFLLLNEGCITESFIGHDKPVNSFSIFFGPESVNQCCGDQKGLFLDVMSRRTGLRSLDEPVGVLLRQLWQRTRHVPIDQSEVQAMLDELLVNLVDSELTEAGKQRRSQQQSSCKLKRARDFMESQYAETIALQDIAGHAALSTFHLSRAFKRQFGVSPMTYLNRKRVEVAERLMCERDLPVGEAAAQVGFVSRATFLRHYRRRFGRLPSAREAST